MNAYLTFVRKNKDYLHLLGIKNPSNIFSIQHHDFISGQPVIVIIENDLILSLYIIAENGELLQIFGKIDYLFQSKILYDLTYKNVKKYNYIRNILINCFMMLSIEEINYLSSNLAEIENLIYHNYLHLDIDLYKIKCGIIKILNKSNLDLKIKHRILDGIDKHKIYKRKLLRKKIDIDLSGYLIKINSLVS